MIFSSLCRKCGFFPLTPTVKISLAEYLGLSVRQIERYIKGADIHPSVTRLLEIRAKGVIDAPEWKGFFIRRGALVNPNGEQWHLSELKTKSLFLQLNH